MLQVRLRKLRLAMLHRNPFLEVSRCERRIAQARTTHRAMPRSSSGVSSQWVGDETAQRKWQRILAEYAIARAEYQIAYQMFLSRPRPGHSTDVNSLEHLAEQKARDTSSTCASECLF